MDSKRILAELEAERARLDRAITAIEGISSDDAIRPKAAKKGVRTRMSAAARKRISQARKLWWAKQKRAVKPRPPHGKKAAPKPTAAKKASRNGGITAAGRKAIRTDEEAVGRTKEGESGERVTNSPRSRS